MATTTDTTEELAAALEGRTEPEPRRPSRRRPKLERSRLPYALIAPALIFMILVHLLPMIGGWVLSLKNLNTFTFARLFSAPWVGFDNYETILFDTDNSLRSGLGGAVQNTFVYVFWTVGMTLLLGLGVALLLNRQMRGQRVARVLMLTPWVIPSFVVASLWQFMWRSDVGIVNDVLVDWTHLLDDRPVWLNGGNTIWALIVPSIWRGIPLAMLIFLAGLQAIPQDLLEAAEIDGAGPVRKFWYVTFPLIRPLLAVQLLFNVVYASYQFALPWVMMGSNPGPDADLLMTLVVRQSFSNKLVGFGAAASTLIMFAMFIWVAVWYVGFRRDLEAAR